VTVQRWPVLLVAKAEHLPKGANPRFIVTSLPCEDMEAKELYETIYCARGEMENRIKECQLDLFANRTSAASLSSNQLRLWFASLAYVLMTALRCMALRERRWRRPPPEPFRSLKVPGSSSLPLQMRYLWLWLVSAATKLHLR
jgi:Transposase DDE domain group 1